MAVSNGCEKFAPDVAVGESGPAERREVRHGGKIFGDVSGVNKDHHIDERSVQGGVKEGNKFHGVDCDGFIAKSAEGGEAAADVEWEGVYAARRESTSSQIMHSVNASGSLQASTRHY